MDQWSFDDDDDAVANDLFLDSTKDQKHSFCKHSHKGKETKWPAGDPHPLLFANKHRLLGLTIHDTLNPLTLFEEPACELA